MISSMTGFGRCELEKNNRKVTIELKSVNHRYCDINIRMPRKFNFYETNIRNKVKSYAKRGKIDVFIAFEDNSNNNVCVNYNSKIAREYYNYIEQIADEFGIDFDLRASALSRYPEVLVMKEDVGSEEDICLLIDEALDEACKSFVDMRMVEGENLKKDLIEKLQNMSQAITFIEGKMPELIEDYRANLQMKVQQLLEGSNIDENRIALEVTLYTDKNSIDEEIVRLKSHIESTGNELSSGIDVGRKLDFIAQEMNREANTILSKSNDLEVSDRAILLKTEVEKIREQIQNIE